MTKFETKFQPGTEACSMSHCESTKVQFLLLNGYTTITVNYDNHLQRYLPLQAVCSEMMY